MFRAATFLTSLALLSGCQQQGGTDEATDGGAQETASREAKLGRAKVVAVELITLRRSVQALEATVPGGAEATPDPSEIGAIVAGFEAEFGFECSDPEENEVRRFQCIDMERLRPILGAVAEFRRSWRFSRS